MEIEKTDKCEKNKALLTAYYFIKKDKKEKKGIDSLKLQKLLYYAQAWNLVFNKKKLFEDKIEAWIRGPVVPNVWSSLKSVDLNDLDLSEKELNCFSNEEKKILDEVWRVYGKYDGEYLELLTHNEFPWQNARKGLSEGQHSNNVISPDEMRKYYSKKLHEDEMAK
ncbi:MAG: DUF4065 domain-containing protein [Candidatus Pacebacteria bacterium]|nr:DUF4065 domain-containing protein [Candidatus Paceibacterota bacterium]